MANTKIRHSTIIFENMDKNDMFVNVVLSSKYRTEIDKNYDAIVEAWTQIENSFQKLGNASSGKVNDMFAKYVTAAKKRKKGATSRKNELDKGLRNDIQSYAKTVLDTEAVESFLKTLGGTAIVASVGQGISLDAINQEQPTTINITNYKTGDSLGVIGNLGKDERYQGCSNFTDKNGYEYVATVKCNPDNNDYNLIIFKKDEAGNFQQISSKKMQTTHGNSVTTKYNSETDKVEIYTTKKYTDHDLDGKGSKKVKHDKNKISRFELDLNDNNITDEEVIKMDDNYTGSVSIDSDNNLYVTSTGYNLKVRQGDFTSDAVDYTLQDAPSTLTHQSGCIHGNMFYKVMWDRDNKKNYLFTYDLTKKNADGKVPYTELLIDSGAKREIEDVSWNDNLGLIVSINNKNDDGTKRSTEFIKI